MGEVRQERNILVPAQRLSLLFLKILFGTTQGGLGIPDIYHSIYQKMKKIGILDVRQYAVIENPPYVPLCIDRLSPDTYAISQNPLVDGLMVADPDVEVHVDHAKETAEPLVYLSGETRKVVYPEPGKVNLAIRNELSAFLDRWLSDLIAQGFNRYQ